MSDVILVVEDEPRMRTILADYFTAHGVEAVLAGDGESALEVFAHRDFDAVLLDVMMPGLDGYGVCRAIRRERARASSRATREAARKPEQLCHTSESMEERDMEARATVPLARSLAT